MEHIGRSEAIARIRAALKRRSGKVWSVTGDRGTAHGWITVHAPPRRRIEHGYMTADDQAELARLFGLDRPVHMQGLVIAPDSRAWYVERAEDTRNDHADPTGASMPMEEVPTEPAPAEPAPAACVTYTTAPEDYDWFGTHTVAIVGTTDRGKTVRKVLSDPNYLDGQRARYGSGLHLAVDETEWQKLVNYGLVKTA
jgi:hypothetical protein